MAEPSPRASRFTIAAAALVLVALAIGSFMVGRRTIEPVPAAAPAAMTAPGSPPAPDPVVVAPSEPVGRAEMIAAAASAADAFAAGRQQPASVTELAGREFEVRLPFGCRGSPTPGPDGLSATYDPVAKALRLRAQPTRWLPQDWLPMPAGEPTPLAETIEGFWVARPWTSSSSCPAAPAAPAPDPAAAAPQVTEAKPQTTATRPPAVATVVPAPAEQTLGIAQFFTPADSRVGRRDGKAFDAVERVPPEAVNLRDGLRLRLRGKIAERADLPPILCRSANGERPRCVVAVKFDEIAVENPATGGILATWDVSSHSARQPAGN